MAEGYFTPWREASEHDCHGCGYPSGRPDGFHLWCERHRLVVVFPWGWPRNISEQPRRLRVAGAARRSARSYKRDTKWCPPERWPIPATSTLRTHEDQHRRRTVSKVKAIDWKHLAKRGWQLALLLIVPGGSIVVLALWWLELSREVPFEVHP